MTKKNKNIILFGLAGILILYVYLMGGPIKAFEQIKSGNYFSINSDKDNKNKETEDKVLIHLSYWNEDGTKIKKESYYISTINKSYLKETNSFIETWHGNKITSEDTLTTLFKTYLSDSKYILRDEYEEYVNQAGYERLFVWIDGKINSVY